jgi:hypothetical protein
MSSSSLIWDATNLCPLAALGRVFHQLQQVGGLYPDFTSSNSSSSASAIVFGTAPFTNGLYTVEASYHPPSFDAAHAACSIANQFTYWHHRLSHLSFHDLVRMGNMGLLVKEWKDVSSLTLAYAQCEDYIMSKGHRLPSHTVTERIIMPDQLVHADIWGPACTPSHGAVGTS